MSARVTGLDLPPIAIAGQLARDVGVDDRARMMGGDVYTATETPGGQLFEVVHTGGAP